MTWETRLHAHHLHNAKKKIEPYRNEIESLYDYCADGSLPLWKNEENYVGTAT